MTTPKPPRRVQGMLPKENPSSWRRAVQDLWRSIRQWSEENPRYSELLKGRARLTLLILSVVIFSWIGILILERANPVQISQQLQQGSPLLSRLPAWLILLFVPLSKWQYSRYLLAPLGTWLFLFIFGALYVKDIYNLDEFRPIFRYVFSSMFAARYPKIKIDGGEIKNPHGRLNTLKEIGGPGHASIQPGNAVIFRRLRRPSQISLPKAYFMRPFETLGTIIDLDDQHDCRDEILAVTQDGIQLHLREINFRYRLLASATDGVLQTRTPLNPYPFSQDAMQDMAYNVAAGETWAAAVGRIVVGAIKGFISAHEIDYLTAPRRDGQNPRLELRTAFFAEEISRRLKTLGTELVWIDIGHLEILEIAKAKEQNVDGQRLGYWASRWIGNINQTHAYGEAKLSAYREKGRVEAQAEFLSNITESLKGFEQCGDAAENVRRTLLVRTAQILEAMAEDGTKQRGMDND